ncbi:hypothetical protein EV702DRAFT_1195150 [Suillus placidus]|uniref:Uncharacterized protein n=1 Tax=Suillus placidus TaxID=48579 RepID=A0A9P7D5F7_9AGAM|nr:hypothetical protein EV702DRAFT_1195150 [Suillus placidus]
MTANDWNIHLFRDGSYPGHPVIARGPKLPTGGPCSGRTWQEHVCEIMDHRAHTRHLIHLLETILSTRMLTEASTRAKTTKCDHMLHIKGGLTHKFYSRHYDDVNPFFSENKAKCINSYAAIAEAHGEPELASKILDTLRMPFPDEDTISALTESRLLDVGTVRDILRFAFDRDLVLLIARTGLVVVATSPFRSDMFDNPAISHKWNVLTDIYETEEEDQPKLKPKKFFL